MLVGVLLLLGLFFFPLWNITLYAPQYPEPIGMDIWINQITDANPHDIKNINLMNHYVGMAEIPTEMTEFVVFPIVVVTMVILGVLAVLTGRPKLYLWWFILMSVLGILGIYDFYLWEYEYGHNLDPKAAIKIPGQGYQPPLIGHKRILNFDAYSTPMAGAYLMFIGMFMTLAAYFIGRKEGKR